MITEPLITIIIPCYNYGKFLTDAIDSVRSQTYSKWECLVIDDGSTDDTRKIAIDFSKSDNRIVYHYKENGGLSSTRNYGIEHAKGNYICFLDADDLLDSEKLEKQIARFNDDSIADIVYGETKFFEKSNKVNLFNNKNKNSSSLFPQLTGKGALILKALIRNNITVVSSPLIRKEVFVKVGDFDISYKSYEDWHFWLRCALADCFFVFEPKPSVCTYIRFGHESMMSDKRKLIVAGIQLRKFIATHLPIKYKPYNYYRLVRSKIKLWFL